MDTDQLIKTLATDNERHERSVGSVLTTALAVAAPVSIIMFFTTLGFRKDIGSAIYNPFFDLKFLVTIALAIAAVAISIHLSRPEASLKGWKWLPDSRRTAWVGCRGRAGDTGGTAVGHATGGNSFAGLHDGDSAAVVAFLDCCIVGAPSRRADMANCLRSLCWTAVGWICADAVCFAMHRRLAVVRGDMVSARYRIGRRGRGAGRVKMAPVLNRWIRRTPPIRSAKDSPLYLASEHC
jgi:Negative regulator of sigma F